MSDLIGLLNDLCDGESIQEVPRSIFVGMRSMVKAKDAEIERLQTVVNRVGHLQGCCPEHTINDCLKYGCDLHYKDEHIAKLQAAVDAAKACRWQLHPLTDRERDERQKLDEAFAALGVDDE